MKRVFATLVASVASLAAAPAAFAASDYLLELDGVKGEASATIEILSWSWGASNPGSMAGGGGGGCVAASTGVQAPRDVATGQASGRMAASGGTSDPCARTIAPRDVSTGQSTGKRSSIAIDEPGVHREVQAPRDVATGQSSGKRQHKPIRLYGSSTDIAASGVKVAVGDVNGDGFTDFADTAGMPEVEAFTLTFDKSTPELAKMCAKGNHFPNATIKARGASYSLENAVVVSCTTAQPKITENQRTADNSMPNRISMNVSTPKQTQGATFGEKVQAGMQAAGQVSVVVTGQLKHTKSGHVTLLK